MLKDFWRTLFEKNMDYTAGTQSVRSGCGFTWWLVRALIRLAPADFHMGAPVRLSVGAIGGPQPGFPTSSPSWVFVRWALPGCGEIRTDLGKEVRTVLAGLRVQISIQKP